MKKAIVTGANGFVGGALVRELLKHNIFVYAIHRGDHNNNIPKNDKVICISCDISDISSLKEKITVRDVDIFYHFAWVGSAGPARTDTRLQLNNAQWTIDSLHTAKELGCKRFLYAGSIIEHETIKAIYSQDNLSGPNYIYGGGKIVAHVMAMSVAVNIGIDYICSIITNAYGPGECSPRLVNTTIRKLINGETPVFTSALQNYDFVYIDDVARAFFLIGLYGKPFHEYIIGSSTARPLKEFLLEMKESISPNLEFIFGNIPYAGVDFPLQRFDCSQTERDTGFKAETSFSEGVRKTRDWILEKECENNDSKI